MKSFFYTFGASLILSFAASSAQAQQGHEGHNHAGHNHQTTPHPNYVEVPGPEIDHVLTESPEDHVLGADTAPVTVIAYASVMCPHCAQWFTHEWPVFKANHIDTGQVRFVFREFPTSPVNYARTGFVIANCAPENEYMDHIVYQMQNQNYIFGAIQAGQARPMYQSMAMQAGLKTQQEMQACFEQPDSYQRMDVSMMRARAAGIQSVPRFIIDGQIFGGNASAQGLGQTITARLMAGTTSLPPQPVAPKPEPQISVEPEPQISMMRPIPPANEEVNEEVLEGAPAETPKEK